MGSAVALNGYRMHAKCALLSLWSILRFIRSFNHDAYLTVCKVNWKCWFWYILSCATCVLALSNWRSRNSLSIITYTLLCFAWLITQNSYNYHVNYFSLSTQLMIRLQVLNVNKSEQTQHLKENKCSAFCVHKYNNL